MPRGAPEAAAWGVVASYTDALGQRVRVSAGARRRALEAMGADRPAPGGAPALVVAPGEVRRLGGPAVVVLEDGTRLPPARSIPPDLPLGLHRLEPEGRAPARALIVTPGRCAVPARPLGGIAVQVYATRSRDSWGIGDLVDVATAGRWAAAAGAGFALLSPLHAPTPAFPQESSPYSPSTRRLRNPLAIRPESVPGWDSGDAELRGLVSAGRALNADRRIDRDAAWRLKRAALARWHATVAAGSGEEAPLRAILGDDLDRLCLYSALAERHGGDWRTWPEPLRDPHSATVGAAARELAGDVAFHRRLQVEVDRQLGDAASTIPLLHDLAVGVAPAGADAWLDRDVLAPGVRAGAPPDAFAPEGQDWGLSAFDPWKLRAADYRPFAAMLRSALRHGWGVRVDHVMGLFRLWWVIGAAGAADGAYVRMPSEDLLAVLTMECARAGAVAVGEDLGTVPRGVRPRLATAGVLSYRLLWFEDDVDALPRDSMAAVTTHDLPTIAGLWGGEDAAAVRAAGRTAVASEYAGLRRRARSAGARPRMDLDGVVTAMHRRLAASPAVLTCVTLDDCELVPERPNLPGTVTGYPSWRLPLPRPLEELSRDPATVARLRAGCSRSAEPAAQPGSGSRRTST